MAEERSPQQPEQRFAYLDWQRASKRKGGVSPLAQWGAWVLVVLVVLENEVRTITALEPLGDGSTRITLNGPLSFFHKGTGTERGEVGLLTRNIRITTDIIGVDETSLESFSQGSRDGRKFSHTMVMNGASATLPTIV